MNIYDVVVILNPTKKEAEEGVEPQVLFSRDKICAPTEQIALLIVGNEMAAQLDTKRLGRLEVKIRPFAQK